MLEAVESGKIDEEGNFTIEVNPRSRAKAKFSEKDELIVIGA